MKTYKSDRLKKLETELNDLEQWLRLGLVPKKELIKHKQEIEDIKVKIEEEKERIQFLKESGEVEEFVLPKRQTTRGGYTEMPTIPDIDIAETQAAGRESQYEMSNDQSEGETTYYEERDDDETAVEKEEKTVADEDEDEESYFSDRARWRRGGIQDPDANDW